MKKQKTQKKLMVKGWLLIGAAVLALAAAAAAVFVLGGFGQNDQPDLSTPVSDGKIYWITDRLQYLTPADNKVPYYTGRALRDNIYVVRMAADGEQVDIKVREMLTVQQMDNWDFMGLLFDEEGYAVDVVQPSQLPGGVLEDVYIQAIEGQTVTLNTSPLYTALERQITVTEQTAVYNVANYDGSGLFAGLAGKLSLGDKVDVVFDEEGNVSQIFTEPYHQPDDVYFNIQRLYDSTLKMTTRQTDSLGYYNFEFAVGGELVNLRTKDQEIASKIDQQSYQWMGLQFNEDGEISGVVTGGVAVHGKGAALNTSVQQIVNEEGVVTVTSLSPSTRVSSKIRLHPDCSVYDFSGGSDYFGQATQLQEGDYIRCLRDGRDRVVYIAVIYRPGVAQHAYVLDRNYDSEEKQTVRTPDGYGYYHIKVTMGGKTMTLRCNDKTVVNYIDSQSTNIVGLRVKDDVILGYTPATYTLAGYYLASGWDVTALNTQQGTMEVTAMSGDAKGTVKTGKLSENLVVYNVSTMAVTVGEISHVQVGDTVRAYTNYKGEVEVIYVIVRPMVSPAYRKLQALGLQEDGYYHYLMAVEGRQVVIKAKAADVVDRMNKSTTLGLYVNSDNVAYKAVAATQVVGSNGGLFGSNYTVTGISGGQLTVSKDGKTLTAPLAAGYKAYDVAAAGSRTGTATEIRVGDTVQCFKNKAGEVTLVYVTKRPTHNLAGHCACYGGEHVADHSACQQLSWQKLPTVVDNKVTITESGSYHLTGNTSATLIIENGLTVNLCLNGYALRARQAVAVKVGADVYVDNGTVMTLGGAAQAGRVYVAKEGKLQFHDSLDVTKASAQVNLADICADMGTGTAKESYTQTITSDADGYVTAFDGVKNALYLKPVAADGHIHCSCGDDAVGCDHREKQYIP